MKANTKPKLFFIFEGRFPSEKAASLFAVKSCEAFVKQGYDLELVVPRRIGRSQKSYMDYYSVTTKFPVTYLPIIDVFNVPLLSAIAFRLSLFTFSLSLFFYLLFHRSKKDIAYSNALVPLYAASYTGIKTLYELHDFPEQHTHTYRHMLERMTWILSTNAWKKDKLIELFKVQPTRIFVEPNAVDIDAFGVSVGQQQARTQLNLSQDARIALYTGHLYGWKGVDTLAQATEHMPGIDVYFVGGTQADVQTFTRAYGHIPNIHIVGHRPHADIPVWQAAADVLILPNTAKEKISAYYTSPMKLFEYMASGRPVVSSDLPSIRQITGDDTVVLVEPDNSQVLATAIKAVCEAPDTYTDMVHRAKTRIAHHTWDKRAERIGSVLMC